MATAREYAYYKRGNKFAIVERNYGFTDGLNYEYSEAEGLGLPTGQSSWKSPQATVSSAIRLTYTVIPKAKDGSAIADESDEIDIPSYLEKALVYYVKARLAEDQGELEMKEYFMREYKKITEKYESSLKPGARMISTPGPYALR